MPPMAGVRERLPDRGTQLCRRHRAAVDAAERVVERAADLEAPGTELGGVDREGKPEVGQLEEVAHVAGEIVVPGDGPGGRLAALAGANQVEPPILVALVDQVADERLVEAQVLATRTRARPQPGAKLWTEAFDRIGQRGEVRVDSVEALLDPPDLPRAHELRAEGRALELDATRQEGIRVREARHGRGDPALGFAQQHAGALRHSYKKCISTDHEVPDRV